MIDHFGINCTDLDASKPFYDTVPATLGFTRQLNDGAAIGYSTEGSPDFWISARAEPGPSREMHLAFSARRGTGPAFHAAATELGAESLHAPRLWPEYHDHYYGAFVRDPDGNNVEAVCHTAPAD